VVKVGLEKYQNCKAWRARSASL